MLCSRPFIRYTGKVTKLMECSYEARQAATPFGCGQCLHCRINRARVWTNRIMLECRKWPSNVYATLTYKDEFLPKRYKIGETKEGKDLFGGSLDKKDLQDFIKRVRKRFEPRTIRYYACGEYGENNGRPHYHLALFNVHYNDCGDVDSCWSRDGVSIGKTQYSGIGLESARYIAGYITKGVDENYRNWLDKNNLVHEFSTMSKGSKKNGLGGIGFGAVKDLAKAINKFEFERSGEGKTLCRSIRNGPRKMPLGRYLVEKLDERVKTNEGLAAEDFWLAQQEVFDSSENGVDYWLKQHQKRLNREKKFKIYTKRK